MSCARVCALCNTAAITDEAMVCDKCTAFVGDSSAPSLSVIAGAISYIKGRFVWNHPLLKDVYNHFRKEGKPVDTWSNEDGPFQWCTQLVRQYEKQ